MSKPSSEKLLESTKFDLARRLIWRRWLLCVMFAILIILAGAIAPQQSQGASWTPRGPVQGDPINIEGTCNLYCPDSKSDLVWTSSSCAICCYRDFPFTCSSETCCRQ